MDLSFTNTQEKIISASKLVFTVKKLAIRNREHGAWPDSEHAIWALRAGAPANGFGKAFITVGRRVLIDFDRFWEALQETREAK